MNFNVKIIIFHLTMTYSYSKLGSLRFVGVFPTNYYGCDYFNWSAISFSIEII
jgi:hypothetical protein